MCDTSTSAATPYPLEREDEPGGSVVMNKDVAPLLELLKMADERWPYPETGQISKSDLFQRDHLLLEMWPEACRRTGVRGREFPPEVIELWKQSLGRVN